MPLVIAHRGASAYQVENSLAAFRAALDMGADGVELDVHVTTDGVPVVHHDPLIGSHAIAEVAFDTLRAHRLANGEPLPTLGTVLDVLGGTPMVFVEVKQLAPAHDERLLGVLADGPEPRNYQVHSFDHRIIRRLRERTPELRCGILSCSYPLRPFVPLLDVGANVLWQQESLIDADLVTAGRKLGLRVFAWTVDDPDRMRQLTEMDVHGLCTNRPDVGRDICGKR